MLIAIGLVSVIASFVMHNHQTWSNLLQNTFYFMAIALGGTFFLAIQYAAEVGWSVVLKRILEAMGTFLPVASILMLFVFFGNYIAAHNGGHYLYHWLHMELYDPASHEYDAIIAGKQGYLNLPFFVIRMVAYFVIWSGIAYLLRKHSLKEDIEGGNTHYFKANVSPSFSWCSSPLPHQLPPGILSCLLIPTGSPRCSAGTPLRDSSSAPSLCWLSFLFTV